jgi:hypothetical protein
VSRWTHIWSLLDESAGIAESEARRQREGEKIGRQVQLKERERSKIEKQERPKGLKHRACSFIIVSPLISCPGKKKHKGRHSVKADGDEAFDVAVEDCHHEPVTGEARAEARRVAVDTNCP